MPTLYEFPHQILKVTGVPVLGHLVIEKARYKEPTGISQHTIPIMRSPTFIVHIILRWSDRRKPEGLCFSPQSNLL